MTAVVIVQEKEFVVRDASLGTGSVAAALDAANRAAASAAEAGPAGAAAGAIAGAETGALAGEEAGTIAGAAAALPTTLANAPAAPFVRNTAIILPANTLGGQAAERVSYTQFMTGSRTDVEAINAAMAEIYNNNSSAGGEVIVPPGPAIACTASITPYPGVKLRGNRHFTVPSWTLTTNVGLIHVDGVNDFEVSGFSFNTSRRCNVIVVTGNAEGLSAQHLRYTDSRGIYIRSGGAIRIHDVIARGGTSLLGLGIAGSGDIPYDIIMTEVQAYDTRAECLDIGGDGVNGLVLDGFTFRRGSLTENNGQIIDVGGEASTDVKIANGLIDCGGAAHPVIVEAIWVKQGARRTGINNVSIINGDPSRSTCHAIHLSESYNTTITNVQVDATFARGLFAELPARDYEWIGGSNNSITIAYGPRGRLNFSHDGGGTSSTGAAVTIGGENSRDVVFSGSIRGRPSATAVDIITGAVSCGVRNAMVENCRRAVALRTGSLRGIVSNLRAREMTGNVILQEANHADARIEDVFAVDCSITGNSSIVTVAAGCNGSTYNGITSFDTRTGAARTAGACLTFTGANYGIQYDRIIGHNIPRTAAVTGTSFLSNSSAGSAVYLVTEPPTNTTLVAAGYIDPAVTISRASAGLRQGTDSIWTSIADNLPRFSGADQGLLIELSQTPILSSRRDLTNAAWTKTNCTAALTATGIDGAANSASTISATSSNATVLQAVTLTSAARTGGAYLRRVSGTGTVQITLDGGSTWTTAAITSTWTRFNVTQTLSNPSFGVRIVTSGDVIEVDYADIEARAFMTSPVPSGSASRATERALWPVPADWPTSYTIYAEFDVPQVYSNQGLLGTNDGGTNNRVRFVVSGTTLQCIVTVSGSNTTLSLGTLSAGRRKIALVVTTTYVSALLDGGSVQTYTGTLPAQTQVSLGDVGATQSVCGLVRRSDALVSAVSDAALTAALAAW